MNERQDERRAHGDDWEIDLYEWKRAIEEMRRLPLWLKRAQEGTLPTDHQQCSRSATEAIDTNRLICALGVDVTACPILASLYASFAQQMDRDQRTANERFPATLDADGAYVLAARVCTWHIFMAKARGSGIDTSEGYVQDESDRRYWSNVYSSLAAADSEL